MRTTPMPRAAAMLLLALSLAGCAGTGAEAQHGSTPNSPLVLPAEITTLESARAWADGLDEDVTAGELSEGLTAITGLVESLIEDSTIWPETGASILTDLAGLQTELDEEPLLASTKIDEVDLYLDNLTTAVARGSRP